MGKQTQYRQLIEQPGYVGRPRRRTATCFFGFERHIVRNKDCVTLYVAAAGTNKTRHLPGVDLVELVPRDHQPQRAPGWIVRVSSTKSARSANFGIMAIARSIISSRLGTADTAAVTSDMARRTATIYAAACSSPQ